MAVDQRQPGCGRECLDVVGAIGVRQRLSGKQHPAVTTTDLGLLAIELVLSLGVGALMGRLAVFRADPADRAVLQARTGWAGVSLWIVLIAVRIGLDLTAHALGASFVASTGVVLILLAVTRGTSALVTRARAAQRTAVSA